MPALLTRTSIRPCRCDHAGDQRLERCGVGHVGRRQLRPCRPRRVISSTVACAFVAARRRDDRARRARASSRAIARPMPRDAPVTIATLSVELRHRESRDRDCLAARRQRLDVLDVLGDARCSERGVARRLLARPDSTVPGPTSTKVVAPSADAAAASRRPSARAPRSGERAPRSRRRRRSSARHRRWRRPGRAGPRREARAARAPAAPRPASSARSGTARSPAAESRAWRRAPWPVRSARATAAALPAITTCPGALRLAGLTTSPSAASRHACSTVVGVEPENRRHRAGADRHRLLHVAAAIAHEAHGIGETRSCRPRRARSTRRGCGRRPWRARAAARPRARDRRRCSR